MKKKKNVALAYGITGNYVDILANTLIGLKKHSKKFWDDIIIFHQGISKEQQLFLNKIVDCKFIELEIKDFLKYISKEQLEMYSVATFFRFESFELLNDYHKVIWSDVDVLYQKDISDLTKYGDKSGYAATFATENYRVENNFFELINEYNMFTPMINAGLFVISDKLKNFKEIQEWCYKSTIKYGSNLRWLDQAILNIMVQEFKLDIEEIPLYEYHCHPSFKKFTKKAKIIHAHGLKKFWNDIMVQQSFPEWYENHEEWMKIYDHTPSPLIKEFLPFVSVIMSVYERYDFLEEAISSILKQTYKNFELIIVVEKSINQNKINKLINKINDPRIVIINNKTKLGFSESLNIGIENAKGKYIARMDDDDISLPLRFEKEVQFMEDNLNVGICDSNAEFFMNAKGLWYYNNPSPEEIKTVLLVTNPICHPSVMMRKEMLEKYDLKYNPNYFSEDYELWSNAVKYFDIYHIDEVLLKYRASNKNITRISSSDAKINESVKKTIKHQFKENLDLDFNDNELELLQRRYDIVQRISCSESATKLRNDIYKRIIERNKVVKYYNQDLLEVLFNRQPDNKKRTKIKNVSKKQLVKKIIKKILRPFYRPFYNSLERRIHSIVMYENSSLNGKLDYLINLNTQKRSKRKDEK